MYIKKITAVVLSVLMVLTLYACGQETKYEAKNIKVAALKGPTAIGMVSLMKNSKEAKTANDYEFKIAASADEFGASLIKGDIQIAAMPCNAATALYNKSEGKVKIAGINTLGVLYIIDSGDGIGSVEDLKGKTIYLTGKGTTPEYTLRYILERNGLKVGEDVKLEFKSEAAEVAAIMAKDTKDSVAMLPQPYVTTVMMNNSNIKVVLDIEEEWKRCAGDDGGVVTGVIVVNTEYYNNNKEAVEKFMEEYEASVQYVNSHVDESAELVEEFGIFAAAVAKKAIPECNITLIRGVDMKDKIDKYLEVLYEQNPASIGGDKPTDDLYAM